MIFYNHHKLYLHFLIFLKLDIENRKEYYLSKREEFNNIEISSYKYIVKKSVLMIFLNKTCFNGLFRVNKSNKFNVPFGDYKNPKICDTVNLMNISKKLKNVKLDVNDIGLYGGSIYTNV